MDMIRVNSRKEKRALASLSLALAVLGISVDDLKNFAEIADENRRLRAANENLTKRLEAATGGKNPAKDDPRLVDYLKGTPTISRPGDRKGGAES